MCAFRDYRDQGENLDQEVLKEIVVTMEYPDLKDQPDDLENKALRELLDLLDHLENREKKYKL